MRSMRAFMFFPSMDGGPNMPALPDKTNHEEACDMLDAGGSAVTNRRVVRLEEGAKVKGEMSHGRD
jgi:hypothetical protein